MLSNLRIWSYLSKDTAPIEKDDQNSNSTVNENDHCEKEKISSNTVNTDKASDWGSYLMEAGKTATNIAAKQITMTAKQLKENVSEMHIIERGNIITKFSDEQLKFKTEKLNQEKKKCEFSLPWIDALNSDKEDENNLKNKILSVSSDERNFTRNPPAGSDFDFNYDLYSPVALLLLKEDQKLAEMRFKLVPKKIKEDAFWRNYFYRISLIKQSMQPSSDPEKPPVDQQEHPGKQKGDDDIRDQSPVTKDTDRDLLHNLKTDMIKSGAFVGPDGAGCASQAVMSPLDSVGDNDDWEAELQKELSEFELVNAENGGAGGALSDDLEKEIMKELEK